MSRTDFNDLVRKHSRSLYGYAFRILRNQEEAEDAVQDVFIKLWNMGNKLDRYSSVAALATTMIKNICIDQIRKNRHIVNEGQSIGNIDQIDKDSPYSLLENRELGAILFRIIDGLPDIYKDTLRLKEIEGLTYEEIIERTGENINTLRVTLSRARKMVRYEFNKFNHERRRY